MGVQYTINNEHKKEMFKKFVDKLYEERQYIEIPWTQESFKTFWKQIQNTMFEIESTTEIQSDKVAKVYDAINRGLVERTGVHIPFPSKELMEK